MSGITTEYDWWDDLSEQQKSHIEEGLADAEDGRVMSSEEFWRRLKSHEDPDSLKQRQQH